MKIGKFQPSVVHNSVAYKEKSVYAIMLTRRTAAYLCMHGSDAPCIGAVFINPLVKAWKSLSLTADH